MTERDEKGKFIRKRGVPTNNNKATKPHEPKHYTEFLIFMVIVSLVLGIAIGVIINSTYFGSNPSIATNQTAKENGREQILDMEKTMITQIIDYQIKYGTDSVQWNIGIFFNGEKL